MVKYKLSKGISILEPARYFTKANAPQQYLHGHYILVDKAGEREFLINDTVKYFIDKFSFPKTQAEVIKEVATDVNSNVKAIHKSCTSFFKYLHHRSIVVPENSRERKMERRTLFKVGDFIGDLCVSEIIANKHNVDIYLTVDKASNTTHVIKLLNPKKVPDKKHFEDEVIDMEHEFEMLEKIRHIPAISQAYAFHKNDHKSPYIVLEHIKGLSLSRYLKQTDNLNETHYLKIIKDILQAFSLLHQSKLVHGDIHPSNIMVDAEMNIKVIDLGLSHQVNFKMDEVTRIGGVYFYMPPERINISSHDKFSKEADFFSDVYQLGIVMYYIFYWKEPFNGFIWEELAKNIKKSEPEFPGLSVLNKEVPQQLIAIIKRCLQKNPVKRYKNAEGLFEDFTKMQLS